MDTVLQVRRRSGGSASVQSGYFGQAHDAFDALVGVLYERHQRAPAAGHGVRAWEVAQQGRAHYVKTSTGFGPGGATVFDVALMREVVGAKVGVKAAGGIHTAAEVREMITAGATRWKKPSR